MLDRCSGRNKDGSPCSARPQADSRFCPWHDPERESDRAEWRRRGGEGKSNARRARKAIAGDLRDLGAVQATMLKALKGLEDGTVEPGVATAMATVARALVAVAHENAAVNFEQQLADLARQVADLSDRKGA